jgi:hypothetical protein
MTGRSRTDLVSLEIRYAIRRLAQSPTFAIVASLRLASMFGVLAVVLCDQPARRAARVDPIVALRAD